MREKSRYQGWRLYKRDLLAKADACVNPAFGELIQFAQLSRDITATLEIEKSSRELLLKINKTQDARRLQLGLRLHDRLSHSLTLMQSSRSASVPPLDDVQQIRTLLKQVYPAGTGMKNPELNSAPPSDGPNPLASDVPRRRRERPDPQHRSG
jgi:hypothetical protein